MTASPETWSEGWWKKHWLGVLLLVLLGFLIGYERGQQDGERKLHKRIESEYPAVARDMLRRDIESDSLGPQRDPDEQWDGIRGR